MAELTRICNHLVLIGFLLNDLGAFFTPVLYAFEERELILDLFERSSGSRMMCNYFRFGGVARDLPEGVLEKITRVWSSIACPQDRRDRPLPDRQRDPSLRALRGVGVLTAEDADQLLASPGRCCAASGVPYDVRRAEPYSIYDRFEFDVRRAPARRHLRPLPGPAAMRSARACASLQQALQADSRRARSWPASRIPGARPGR